MKKILDGKEFEMTEAEILDLENSRVEKFDSSNYSAQVNQLHNALFTNYYTSRNYLSMGEIALWLNHEDYAEEAQALIAWWQNTCKIVEEHIANANENSDAQAFIDSLPKFEL